MKTLTKIILTVFLPWTLVCGLWTNSYAEIPHLINYQGRLTDSSGIPLNGAYNLTFRIYDAEAAGNLLWEEIHSGALIQKGIFSVLLGSVTNLNLPFDKSYWLEIKVGNEVMSPRQRITSAGYAIRAEGAEKIKASGTDTNVGYLDSKAKNSITVDNNQLQLTGDSASPGNSKYYGTDTNGTKGFYSLPLLPFTNMQAFTTSGTWIRPAGVTKVYVKVWGGGGGGGDGSYGYGGGGGGAGGYSEGLINVSVNATVIVGAGGGGGVGASGNPGGVSSFVGDYTISANGGDGGGTGTGSTGANGGSSSGGSINLTGASGYGANNDIGRGGDGGPSYFVGGGGSGTHGGSNGYSAKSYGAGGGGAGRGDSGQAGGNGMSGLVIVYW